MFSTKPPTPSLEFNELSRVFDRGALAMLFGRDPDTVGRWRKAQRVPHTVETTVDRFWWVMHVACAERHWPVDAVRYFLLSIEPRFGRRPAELVRESDEQCRSVVEFIVERPAPATGQEQEGMTREKEVSPMADSPFAHLLADEPGDSELLIRGYRPPSLAGRVRPIGGVEEDPFRIEYTATRTHAIPLDEPVGAA